MKRIIDAVKKRFGTKIFITGDMGKLGSLTKKKLSEDFYIVGYDSQRNESENLLDEKNLTKKMKGAKIVIHLAAIPHPNPHFQFEDYFKVNVIGTFNVLKAAQINKVGKFIYISSTAYYGCNTDGKINPLYFPIDETHPPASRLGITKGKLSAYGQSKVIAEELCAFYGTNNIFETVVLRSGPANEFEVQYGENFNWEENDSYQKSSFWAINNPKNLIHAIELAVKSKDKLGFEVFNVMNKYTPKIIDVKKFLKRDYPKTQIRKINIDQNPSLFDTTRIEKKLGFKSVDIKSFK